MSIRNANGESVDGTVGKIADLANAPTSISATNVGTARSYNDGSATVSFTGDTSYWAPTSYTATSSPGSFTASGASSPLTVTGLQSATGYTFSVKANNSAGASAASAASASITATTIPQAPTIGTFTDGGTGTTGTLSFTAGATGGSTITGYKFSTDGTTYNSASGTTSPLSLTGLTAGTYNFSLKATNTNGDSLASGNASGTVIFPSSFESIATATATGGEMSLSLTSIPSTYKSLQVRIISRDTATFTGAGNGIFYVNGDTSTSYTYHKLIAYSTTTTLTAQGGATTASGGMNFYCPPAANTGAAYGVAIIDIIDYSDTSKYKTMKSVAGWNNNSATTPAYGITLASTLWTKTNAITSMNIVPYASGFSAGTSIALYGIKG